MKIKIPFLCAIIMFEFFLSNCKKGPEDPAISLRSRKARLSGEWIMKSGSAALTKAPYNQNFAFNGTKLEMNETEAGGPAIIYTGAYSVALNISKDGSFNFRENFAGSIIEGSGHWDFEPRSSNAKNKEEVKFTIDAITKGIDNEHIFNQTQSTFIYKFIELRNKEIKIEALDKTYTTPGGVKVAFSSRYTFAQL